MKTGINIKSDIITWAIARAGYKLEDFIHKLPRVQDWIENKKEPTLKQLEDFSNKVHVPLGYLFLPEIPQENNLIPFFRSNTANTNEKVSLNLYDTIALLQQRQEWLEEYLLNNDYKPLPFVGKYNNDSDYKEIINDIRKTLNLDIEWANKFKNYEETLNALTSAIEDAGIVVSFNSVFENNNHRPIEVNECRGFVLTSPIAPFMFINAADGKGAQIFTLVHELAHIWIGVSAGFESKQLLPANDPLERLCDRVAAEFLVPTESFNRLWDENPSIEYLAKYFKVSEIVIARRALDLNKITRAFFFGFYNKYIFFLHSKKAKQSGGDFYATQKKRLSLRFAAYVNQAVRDKSLLYKDAYRMTGLKGETFQNFITQYL